MTEENITLAEAMEYAADRAAEEVDGFDGEVPNHAPRLVSARGSDMNQTAMNIDMASAKEGVDSPTEEQSANALVEDAVDVLLALGTLQFEHEDMDIAAAFESRIQAIEDYKAFREAMSDVETQEQAMEVMDEYMNEEVAKLMESQGMGRAALGGATPIQPGDNVDDAEYDHDEEDHAYQ